MEMNMDNSKIELIQWLTTLEDKSIIEKLIEMKQSYTDDWWSELSDVEKKSVEKGLQDADNGKVLSQSEVRKKYEKWL